MFFCWDTVNNAHLGEHLEYNVFVCDGTQSMLVDVCPDYISKERESIVSLACFHIRAQVETVSSHKDNATQFIMFVRRG